MTIRTELETVLYNFGQLNNLPIAWEGVPFDSTKYEEYIQIFFLNRAIYNPTLEFSRKRTIGMLQINVCVKDGYGSNRVEELAEAVAALYPASNKQAFETVSIERHPQIGRAMIDANFRVIPVTIEYRQES